VSGMVIATAVHCSVARSSFFACTTLSCPHEHLVCKAGCACKDLQSLHAGCLFCVLVCCVPRCALQERH
jgi:hypothetical protein